MNFKILSKEKLKTIKNFQCFSFLISEINSLKEHPLFVFLNEKDKEYFLKILENLFQDEKDTITLNFISNPKNYAIFLKKQKNWILRKRQYDIRKIIRLAKNLKLENLIFYLNDFSHNLLTEKENIETLVENILMADYDYLKYKEKKENIKKLTTIYILVDKKTNQIKQGLKEGIIIGKEVNECRDLANTPGGDLTPSKIVDYVKRGSKKIKNLNVKILTEKEIKKLSMGGILGVSRGSQEKPYFIILKYFGTSKKEKPLVFIGKGVTFDSGGLNIKLKEAMSEMYLDMSGGSAVINGIQAIAKLGLPINVVGLVPVVENMLSGSSYRPGDILKTISGKTIEVINTDAEGRIILADAIGYAKRYNPKIIIDIATLTGAALIALGQRMSAFFTNDENLVNIIKEIGERSGDYVWQLPLWEEYAEDIKGDFGDVRNVGKNQYGGTIEGAIFLKQFIGEIPWIHLDIAPTMTTIEEQNLAKGASGVGVRFLAELARKYAKNNEKNKNSKK